LNLLNVRLKQSLLGGTQRSAIHPFVSAGECFNEIISNAVDVAPAQQSLWEWSFM